MRKFLPYLAILTAMVIWATAGIATKLALQSFEPLTLVTLRFLMAVALMLIVGLSTHTLVKIEKKDIPLFLLAGFAQPFLYYIFETYGMRLIGSPTVAEVLLCTSPLFAPLFAYVLLKEKITRNNIIGILISTAGVLMMILIGGQDFVIGNPWAVLLLILAVFSAVLYTTLLRKMPVKYNSLSIVFYVQLFALLFFIPVWVVLDLPHLQNQISAFSLSSFASVVYLAVFSSVIAFILFCYVVRQIGVTRANAFNNIRPVFTALIMLLVFSEHLVWQKWVAMIIVIIGLFISQKQEKIEKNVKFALFIL